MIKNTVKKRQEKLRSTLCLLCIFSRIKKGEGLPLRQNVEEKVRGKEVKAVWGDANG
jgi:hypothetical protein